MANKTKAPQEAFHIPISDTGERLTGTYDFDGSKTGVNVNHKNRPYRPSIWDWNGALIHLVAKALDGQVEADRTHLFHILETWLSDNSSKEPGPSTVRDMVKKIMDELERVRVRDE